ncbi:hypothetical protein Q8F55_005830 [Vanrija albida]|uniref:Zn(2)-C6 fungal-type domain-containing protein n=1 Tax=Vanrija albida TaxID=181172 RepID=A0ABR3Q3H2_9TREE
MDARTDTPSSGGEDGSGPQRKRLREGSPRPYKKRAYGQSCYACRERKIKCEVDGEPPCRSCIETNTLCESVERAKPARKKRDLDGILASIEARLQKLDDLEARTRRLESASHSMPGGPSRVVPSKRRDSRASSPPSDEPLSGPRYDLGPPARPVYHGEVSMFDDSETRPRESPRLEPAGRDWTPDRLKAAARLRHRYAPPEDGETWVDSYFCWASTQDYVVHRPLFRRDMALGGGPWFSEFLLVCMYVPGIRLTYGMDQDEREQKGEQYFSLAMSMLPDILTSPPTFANTQALLVLAGRQVARGQTTQAWVFTGMAIRLMQDMGMHLPPSADDATRFSQEERDQRTRLFWAAYTWDKATSLVMGREPCLPLRPYMSPDALPADPDDDADWVPCVPEGARLPINGPYPKHPMLKTLTLRHNARLFAILESILTNMYSPGLPNARSVSFIRTAIEDLEAWRKSIPDVLKLEPPNLPEFCPPPNIVVSNMLYHAMRILAYRPLLTDNGRSSHASTALSQCRNASAGVSHLLSLWGKTFGDNCHHYIILYCSFISASVDILLIRSGIQYLRDEAFQRVHLALTTLENAQLQGPCISRGVVNIRSQLNRAIKDFGLPGHQPLLPAPPPAYVADIAQSSPQPLSESRTQHDVSSDAAQPPAFPQWFPGAEFWESQTLLDMLSAAPISTEDPFAFGATEHDLGLVL